MIKGLSSVAPGLLIVSSSPDFSAALMLFLLNSSVAGICLLNFFGHLGWCDAGSNEYRLFPALACDRDSVSSDFQPCQVAALHEGFQLGF
jgi:hypothetical protein